MSFKEVLGVGKGYLVLSILWLFSFTRYLPVFKNGYRTLLCFLVSKTGLFDEKYYKKINTDLEGSSFTGLYHFVAYGNKEGRNPHPLFDTKLYRSKARGFTVSVNALLHYVYIGRFLRLSPTPWIDIDFYLKVNRDVRRSGIEPIVHYLHWGGVEGRSPNPQFDGRFYLEKYPEVHLNKINPLLHYLEYGWKSRTPTSSFLENNGAADLWSVEEIKNIDSALWKEVSKAEHEETAVVDVIIPVYKDYELTLRAIYSVLNSTPKTPYALIVINDKSPDAKLTSVLQILSDRGLFSLIANEKNLGFIKTVNLAMDLHPDRDVVLLNSDAEVYNDWLDRLVTAGQSSPNVASVTPLSNNATICSYPVPQCDNPYPLEISYEMLDQMTSDVNAGRYVTAPTGVGFCMYISRKALNEIGFFDYKAFGKGYGEENDWCQRAINKRWVNLIAADVFVRHFGSASFQGEWSKRDRKVKKILKQRYPEYHNSVYKFIDENILHDHRCRLDVARLVRFSKKRNTLIISHSRGGGAERHVEEDTAMLRERGEGVFYLRPVRGKELFASIEHPDCHQITNVEFFSLEERTQLVKLLNILQITSIHTHGLVDYGEHAPELIAQLAEELKVPLLVDIHDYKVICPRINLVDKDGAYCGEPDEAECNRCLSKNNNDFGAKNISAWRNMHHQVLKAASEIYVPDQDVSERIIKYYPDLKFNVTPHCDIQHENLTIIEPEIAAGKPLKIVIVGAIGVIKGFNVLVQVADYIKKNKLPIELTVMGFTLNDTLAEKKGIKVTGRYDDHLADEVLMSLSPHVVWLPATWPETYSYTLSLALKNSLPVFGFDIGAIASRLRRAGWDKGLMDLSISKEPKKIATNFLKYRESRVVENSKGCL